MDLKLDRIYSLTNYRNQIVCCKIYSANFLLDQNGTIIAKNIREEALYNKVKELLGGK